MAWQEDFNRRILTYLASNGGIVNHKPSKYSTWEDYKNYLPLEHVKSCGVNTEKSRWQDSEWTEFDGTFAEPSFGRHAGIDAHVTCTCGKVQDLHIRCEKSRGQLLTALAEMP